MGFVDKKNRFAQDRWHYGWDIVGLRFRTQSAFIFVTGSREALFINSRMHRRQGRNHVEPE